MVFLTTFAIYNLNGREIGASDTQSTKYAAIELATRGTLTLDAVVARDPELGARLNVIKARGWHVRSVSPVAPSVMAAGVARLLAGARLVDLTAPLAVTVVAKLTASLLTAAAVAMAFVVAARRTPRAEALLLAAGLGLGTNLWAQASQTLWQTETVVFATVLAVACLAVPQARLSAARVWIASACLGLAGAARPQMAPAIAVVAMSMVVRRPGWTTVFGLLPLAVIAGMLAELQTRWFGTPLGPMPYLESLHTTMHGVSGSFGNPLRGAAGLLLSPSRGLLVFSPVVMITVGGVRQFWREGWRGDLFWWGTAALVQLALYSSYSVWWGGHTYGPRYLMDVLPLLVPIAATALATRPASRWWSGAAAAALAWSIAVAGLGAFVYPAERWNNRPANVDHAHERLWDWRDPQIIRCWKSPWHPGNFVLFDTAAWRAASRMDSGSALGGAGLRE